MYINRPHPLWHAHLRKYEKLRRQKLDKSGGDAESSRGGAAIFSPSTRIFDHTLAAGGSLAHR